jgi:hypothetical protein
MCEFPPIVSPSNKYQALLRRRPDWELLRRFANRVGGGWNRAVHIFSRNGPFNPEWFELFHGVVAFGSGLLHSSAEITA